MKIIRIILSLLILVTSSNIFAEEKSEFKMLSEAVGFVGTMKFFIGRAARDCRPILGESESWMHGVVNNWLSRNSQYSEAAEKWVNLIANRIMKTQGRDAAMRFGRSIMGSAEDNANSMVRDLLKDNKEENKKICGLYEKNVANGKYDIKESTPLFGEISKLKEIMKNV